MAWSGGEGACEFTCDPSAFHDGTGAAAEWSCPHDVLDGRDRCPFHCDPDAVPVSVSVSDAFLDAIAASDGEDRRDRERGKQFLGATIDDLDLSMAVVNAGDNYPIDLRGATVGRIDCTDSEFGQRIDLRGATVAGTATFDGTYYELDARDATLGEVVFTDVTAERLDWRNASVETGTFDGAALSTVDARDATFGTASFERASLRDAAFDRADFGTAKFRHATVEMADFDDATFETGDFYHADFDEADFRGADFGRARFYGATFGGGYFNETSYDEADFARIEAERFYLPDARLTDATFADAVVSMKLVMRDAVFAGVDFAGLEVERLDVTDARFVGSSVVDATIGTLELDGATLASPRFEDSAIERVNAAEVTLLGTVRLSGCHIGDLDLRPAAVGPGGVALLSLAEATLDDGTACQPEDGALVYDLDRATLGTVRFECGDAPTALERVAFHRTRFDGFDFRDDDDIDLEAGGYRLHALDSSLRAPIRDALAYADAVDDAVATLHDGETDDPDHLPGLQPPDGEGADGEPSVSDGTATVTDGVVDRTLSPAANETFDRLTTAADGQIGASAGEVTYLRAKNGANAIADNTAAAEFFMSQMAYRRRSHGARARDADATLRERARGLVRWGMNGFLFVTTGYGERASYALAASTAIITAYALAYVALAPDLFDGVGQYVQLSLGSFIAFFLGGIGEVSHPTVSLVAQSEAFLGGFFIALYVFALTRSVNR
ncbi:pentapeptide repeat-containing protein [Haloarcula salina]|uniref:Pentapeptide repeat-containing protein n=1 Tax=Haloarcula salina TaxID=1429914 RepID=A0AA41G3L1_9EURY|nr:pentapeptide repeat-containing protein [Haloarcula salina]MBV0903688.1 pentapeptide repeat-containing protein [Haloarcula salina]